mmetsp:Transcript_12771/g.27050  ORF Transcript_12771/g.27050 Transcript_12771/m.27050 type:complete len:105 (+) Transcript_12771:1151-1465(+)
MAMQEAVAPTTMMDANGSVNGLLNLVARTPPKRANPPPIAGKTAETFNPNTFPIFIKGIMGTRTARAKEAPSTAPDKGRGIKVPRANPTRAAVKERMARAAWAS